MKLNLLAHLQPAALHFQHLVRGRQALLRINVEGRQAWWTRGARGKFEAASSGPDNSMSLFPMTFKT